MEVENKLYAETHGDGQGQVLPADPPKYTPTPQQQQPGQFQGFTPTTAAASPYYALPSGTGYGGGFGVPPASQQQQQQQLTIVAANQAPTVCVQHVESYAGAMIYSCFVFWCCNWIFGLIAFILACEYSAVNSSRTQLVCFLAFS